jgi:hypothetical protein
MAQVGAAARQWQRHNIDVALECESRKRFSTRSFVKYGMVRCKFGVYRCSESLFVRGKSGNRASSES